MKRCLTSTLFLFVVSMLTCSWAMGREGGKDCKPIRANRHKKMIAERPQDVAVSWRGYSDGNSYSRFFRRGGDSVVVYKGEQVHASFLYSNGEILMPYMEYEEAGDHMVDSIDFRRGTHTNGYYGGLFNSRHVVSTANLTKNSHRYYTSKGTDSVLLTWYPNGVLARLVDFNSLGPSPDTMEWSRSGILAHKAVRQGVFNYYADGTLQSRRFDTGIGNHRLVCLINFYHGGVRASVAYFKQDTPCHVWLYYDSLGQLARQVNRKPLSAFGPSVGYVEAPPQEQIFRYVEQHPDFRGGFDVYLNSLLPDVVCQSRKRLSGVYKVVFRVAQDGSPTLISVSGENAEAITEGLRGLIGSRHDWRAGRMNGYPTSWDLVTMIRVVEDDR